MTQPPPPPPPPPGPPGPPGPPQPPYPGYPPQAPTNTLAIVSLITAFLCAPAGLITGIIATSQIKRTHESGSGLAIAGIVIGGLQTLAGVAVLLLFLLGGVAANTFDHTCSVITTTNEPSETSC